MGKRSVHEITMSRRDLAAAQRTANPGALLSPLSPAELEAHVTRQKAEMAKIVAGTGPKPRREMKNVEHKAQRRLYEREIPNAQTRYPDIAQWLEGVYAIPVFNANYGDKEMQRRAQIQGQRLKLEGAKAGSPDNHIPSPAVVDYPEIGTYVYGSLFLELKAESYPNEAQRERFPILAACRNAVVTIRDADEMKLAEKAILTIVRYLLCRPNFAEFGHPSHTFIHNDRYPKGDR